MKRLIRHDPLMLKTFVDGLGFNLGCVRLRMIHKLVKRFQCLDRDIEALSYVLVAFILILAAQAALFVYERRYDRLWTLLAPTTSLLAALLVARVANRLIANGDIIRTDDRRQDIVRTTHHFIAISQDLRARVGYVKAMLSEGGRPAFALSQIAETIENRYETLLERDAYKFLPGNCVDIITRMSGSIFGIALLAEGVKHITTENPVSSLADVLNKDKEVRVSRLDELMTDLQELIDELFKLRMSIDAEYHINSQ